jgi:3-dehydroquinate synthase
LPEKVIVDTQFIKTLPKKELLNGFAELIKYALIGNAKLWEELKQLTVINYKTINKTWIEEAIRFKENLVAEDLHDKGSRQILNFGHTVGHAIERLYAEKKRTISHGYAVAMGICYEAYGSHKKGNLSLQEYEEILQLILRFFKPLNFIESDITALTHYCLDDKKNKNENVHFVFLKEIGKAEN